MTITIKDITMEEEVLNQIANLYVENFPQSKTEFINRLQKHSTYPGFKGGIACKGEKSKIVGFCYGYTSLPGQYYRGLIEGALTVEQQSKWLVNCFEFAELAVMESERRKGIGEMLHNYLLAELPHHTALLTTQLDNTPAQSLYLRLGWENIMEPFYPGEVPYTIFGKKL